MCAFMSGSDMLVRCCVHTHICVLAFYKCTLWTCMPFHPSNELENVFIYTVDYKDTQSRRCWAWLCRGFSWLDREAGLNWNVWQSWWWPDCWHIFCSATNCRVIISYSVFLFDKPLFWPASSCLDSNDRTVDQSRPALSALQHHFSS